MERTLFLFSSFEENNVDKRLGRVIIYACYILALSDIHYLITSNCLKGG